MTIFGNATRIQRCREKKAGLGLERIEICLGGDMLDRLREDAKYQWVPFPQAGRRDLGSLYFERKTEVGVKPEKNDSPSWKEKEAAGCAL